MTTQELQTIERIASKGCQILMDGRVIIIDMTGAELVEIPCPEQGFDITKLLKVNIRQEIEDEENIYIDILKELYEII